MQILSEAERTKFTREPIEELLSRMSLAEKVGQMTQLDITLINPSGVQKDVRLDAQKARTLITTHHIGSFLNGEAVPPVDWYVFMEELTRIAVEESRLGIPLIYGIDHIHGASYVKGSTLFPHSINLGATFDPEHARMAGRITALESADLGHHWVFAPVMDLGVNPMWPRFYETYGEDPLLCGRMGAAFVDGLQNESDAETGRQAATAKHFLGYSDPRSGWDRTPAQLSVQQIQEWHRPAFQMVVDAGVKAVMVNSGEINGVPVHASRELLTDLLRGQMGFDGVVVTDWDDIRKLVDFHHVADDYKEATFQAVTAGIDMSMTPLTLDFNVALTELVNEGRIPESRIDESVRRILRLKADLGLFEQPYPRDDRFHRVGLPEHRSTALQAARESLVLLKNRDDLLPATRPKRVGVCGPSADSRRNLSGGWTISWQGGEEARHPRSTPTLVTALREAWPEADVVLHPDMGRERLDLVIYAGGEEPYCEFVGNLTDIRLPDEQTREILDLCATGVPVVLVLVQGRPRVIDRVVDAVHAVVHAGLPGPHGATAIADLLSGAVQPSGRLPFTYPMHPNHHLPYHHKRSDRYCFDPKVANRIVNDPRSAGAFPFGFGLGYTTFGYSDLAVDGDLRAEVTVTNTGSRPGTETVCWFTSTLVGRITRPVKQLRGYEKLRLEPGASARVSIRITPGMLAYPDAAGVPVVEDTRYAVSVGGLETEFRLTARRGGGSARS
jgi:beta-glucosidase